MKLQVPELEVDMRKSLQTLFLGGSYRIAKRGGAEPPEPLESEDRLCIRNFHEHGLHVRMHMAVSESDEEDRALDDEWLVSYAVFVGDAVAESTPDSGTDAWLDWMVRDDRPHAINLTARYEFDDGEPRSRFPLPLEVPSLELPGFDSINGVSLAKHGKESDDDPLYTLILQMRQKSLLASVRTTVVSTFNENIVIGCAERSIQILRMGVT